MKVAHAHTHARVFADVHSHFWGYFFPADTEDQSLATLFFGASALVEAVRRDRRLLLRTRSRTMPRSFLVKKYFAKQKPNYSELECQNGEFEVFCLLGVFLLLFFF